MTYSLDVIAQYVQLYFLPFVRIGGLFLTMPVFGTRVVPARTRIIAAFVITIVVAPLVPYPTEYDLISLAFFSAIIAELLIGGTIGFVFQVAFQCFVLAGQIIAMKIGLGFAQMNDPVNGTMTTVISQFYLVAATLLFIAFDGHLVLLEMVVEHDLVAQAWGFLALQHLHPYDHLPFRIIARQGGNDVLVSTLLPRNGHPGESSGAIVPKVDHILLFLCLLQRTACPVKGLERLRSRQNFKDGLFQGSCFIRSDIRGSEQIDAHKNDPGQEARDPQG